MTIIMMNFIGAVLVSVSIAFGQVDTGVPPVKADTTIPHGYFLEDYFPIPFSPVSWARFGIPDTCRVTMFATDSLDHSIIDTLYSGALSPGVYRFDCGDIVLKHRHFVGYLHLQAEANRRGWPQRRTSFTGSVDIRTSSKWFLAPK